MVVSVLSYTFKSALLLIQASIAAKTELNLRTMVRPQEGWLAPGLHPQLGAVILQPQALATALSVSRAFLIGVSK